MKAIFVTILAALTWAASSAELPKTTLAKKQGVSNPYDSATPPVMMPTSTPQNPSAPPQTLAIPPPNSAASSTSPAPGTPAAAIAPALSSETSNEAIVVVPEKSAWVLGDERRARPSFRIGFGYTHSRWSKFSSKIKDGSFAYDIGFEREWFPDVEGGLHVSFLNTATDAVATENVRAFHVAVQSRYLLMPGNLKPFVGLGLGVGSYRVWSLGSEFPTSVTFVKHGSGILAGVLPEIGMRFVTGARYHFDLSFGYSGYLSAPQWKIGGWNFLAAFAVTR